jgi:indolepyruvate ferredoxin oxidoreductase beta subunit
MKFDMIVAGVGGQGILSISFVMDNAALEEGLTFKQSEVHGMAQRGGAVVSHLRVSDTQIFSDLVPMGKADLVLSMEPLETLRYVQYLSPEGTIISSTSPFVNIPNYPEADDVIAQLQGYDNHTLINGAEIARAAGSIYAQNIVMLGAASEQIPVDNKLMEKFISVLFEAKGERVVNANITAFRYGAVAGQFYRDLLAHGVDHAKAAKVGNKVNPGDLSKDAAEKISALVAKPGADNFLTWLSEVHGLVSFSDENFAKWEQLNMETAALADFE